MRVEFWKADNLPNYFYVWLNGPRTNCPRYTPERARERERERQRAIAGGEGDGGEKNANKEVVDRLSKEWGQRVATWKAHLSLQSSVPFKTKVQSPVHCAMVLERPSKEPVIIFGPPTPVLYDFSEKQQIEAAMLRVARRLSRVSELLNLKRHRE